MLKVKSKKKTTKAAPSLKTPQIQKKPLVQPEWNSTQSDLDRYKLSQAELVQKKVSYISKHRFEAKELWLQRQEKLKRGILDEETQSVMETCMLTKRPPEKNMKNLTFFIKDDNFDQREYLDSRPDHHSDEEDLTLNDLQHEKEFEIKPKPKMVEKKPKKLEDSQKKVEKIEEDVEKEEKEEDDDDFLKKVNQSLKDARDLMSKIDRYPSIVKSKNPEKALHALSTIDKENKQNTPSLTKSKSSKPTITTTTTNLKASTLSSSKGSQKPLSASLENKNRKSLKSPTLENTKKKVIEETPVQEHHEEEQSAENQEDISHYFKSLNQIEDTIKFLENNIIGIGKDESKSAPKEEENSRGTLNPINIDALLQKKPEKIEIKESPIRMENKRDIFDLLRDTTSPQSMFTKFDDHIEFTDEKVKPSVQSQFDHEKSDKEEEEEEEEEEDEEQISFALTMKSNEQPEKRSGYGANLFNFDDEHHPSIYESESKPSYSMAQQQSPPAYPKVVFENKALHDKNFNQSIHSDRSLGQSQLSQHKYKEEPEPVEEDNEEEDDLNIERIKKLLQATKQEIEKMNTNHADSYNNTFRSAVDTFNKENTNSAEEFRPAESFGYRNRVSYDPKLVTTVKHDPIITVKQPFNPVWENQRRVLGDIGNREEMPDDDVPAPQTLSISKHIVAHSPQKTEDISLNFRSFRKK